MSQEDLSRAYTTIASDYDRLVEGDAWMRQVLWDRYLQLFPAGERVLDVGCGTGADAIFLAQQGRLVTGIDISPGMIDQLHTRAEQTGLADRVNARVLDLTDLRVLLPASLCWQKRSSRAPSRSSAFRAAASRSIRSEEHTSELQSPT